MHDTTRRGVAIGCVGLIGFAGGLTAGRWHEPNRPVARAEVVIANDGLVTGFADHALLHVMIANKSVAIQDDASVVTLGHLPADLLPSTVSPGPEGHELRWVPRHAFIPDSRIPPEFLNRLFPYSEIVRALRCVRDADLERTYRANIAREGLRVRTSHEPMDAPSWPDKP